MLVHFLIVTGHHLKYHIIEADVYNLELEIIVRGTVWHFGKCLSPFLPSV